MALPANCKVSLSNWQAVFWAFTKLAKQKTSKSEKNERDICSLFNKQNGRRKAPAGNFLKNNFLLSFSAGEIVSYVKIQRIFFDFRTHVLDARLQIAVRGLNRQIKSDLFAAQNLNRIDALVQS